MQRADAMRLNAGLLPRPSRRVGRSVRSATLVAVALVLAGCSSDSAVVPNAPSKIFSVPEWASFRSSSKPATGLLPVTADELVNADGQCGGADTTIVAAQSESASGAEATRGVAPEMTECQVIRRVGRPDHVEIGADPGGQRATVISYIQGARPGIYHFVDGRLKQVERAPEPPAPAKAQKRVKPKTASN